MKRIVKSSRNSESSDLNMAPLIDMIFILLIFFLVAGSFVKKSGVIVTKSIAETAEEKEKTNLILGITRDNEIYIEGRKVDIRDVQGQMERFLLENPDGYVVISPDRDSRSEMTLKVQDYCRDAGIKHLSISAEKPE
ncbi:MAG: biopolymer transporter ExbD [Desulfobacteraceae bacterium]